MEFPRFNVDHAFIRHRDDGYISHKCSFDAYDGLTQLGVSTSPFTRVEEVLNQTGPCTMVVGGVEDILSALRHHNRSLPEEINYPPALKPYLYRRVYRTTLGDIRAQTRPVFIKPVKEKLFTGFVWDGSEMSRRKVVTLGDRVALLASTPVRFVSEFRTYVLNGEILDVLRYKGIWSIAPSENVVRRMVSDWKRAPIAYSLDVGVNQYGLTMLVECNDSYALGNYGLNNVLYARMMMARWEELWS